MKQFSNYKIPIILFLVTLALEIFLWNAGTFASLSYREAPLGAPVYAGNIYYSELNEAIIFEAGASSIAFSGLLADVKNLYLDIELLPGYTLPYTIFVTDEGNVYPYDLPSRTIVGGVAATQYTRIYTYGQLTGLEIHFEAPETLLVEQINIRANVTVPLNLSGWRIAATFVLLLTAWLLLSGRAFAYPCQDGNRLQLAITAAVVAVLILFLHRLATQNPVYVAEPFSHQKQYQQLAERLREGEVTMAEKPGEALLNAANPFDFIWRSAEGIHYLADHVLYKGNYYVYFGIGPVLLLYLPHLLITGEALPNHLAVFWLFSSFAVLVFALLRELVRRYFPQTPFMVYIILSILTVFTVNHVELIVNPDMYEVPITAAIMCTFGGLWLWLLALRAERNGARAVCLALGSLFMAYVAACRPQLLFFSALALPLFYEAVFKERTLFSRKSKAATLAFCLPYVLVAAGVMYYNYIRFDSPFNFGIVYGLGNNDIGHRPTNLSQTWYGLFYFFLRLPDIKPFFPFVHRLGFESAYMGRFSASEWVYGGVLACNALLWFLGFAKAAGAKLREKKLVLFTAILLVVSLAIAVSDVNMAGVSQRYMLDFSFALALAAVTVALAWGEKMQEAGQTKVFAQVFVLFLVLQLAFSFLIVFTGGDYVYSLQTNAPEVYYRVASWF
ncbi:MAG: hypothetical protein LBI54_10970 [Lachnospiraceae bacterium]|nr:hypothetical protein [Lachnospiraceae bacterium]